MFSDPEYLDGDEIFEALQFNVMTCDSSDPSPAPGERREAESKTRANYGEGKEHQRIINNEYYKKNPNIKETHKDLLKNLHDALMKHNNNNANDNNKKKTPGKGLKEPLIDFLEKGGFELERDEKRSLIVLINKTFSLDDRMQYLQKHLQLPSFYRPSLISNKKLNFEKFSF